MIYLFKMTKSSGYKSSTSSIQNALILLLFIIGLFVMYRYVKTLETEMKLLHNHIIEITEKTHQLDTEQKNLKSAIDSGMCPMPPPFPPHQPAHQNSSNAEIMDLADNNDDDNESIQSDDITNILRKVIGGVAPVDILDPEHMGIHQTQQNCTLEEINEDDERLDGETMNEPADADDDANDMVENNDAMSHKSGARTLNIDDDEDDEGNTTETANTSPDRLEELYKKTNEELKTILKSHGLATKGAKSDLVERIVSNDL